MSDPSRQTVRNLQGEIAFRRKLARQHTQGEMLLPDYYGKDEHDAILAERVATTTRTFESLRAQGIDFSAFLELGAERGHRSLALVNNFDATGIACDLSLDQLRTADHFATLFGLPKLPLRICCDASHLPFRSDAIPFVFCYQFLHHFPTLETIVPEIHRVLAPGVFFFDEEPMGRILQLHLYKQKNKEYSRFNIRKGKLIRWLESFISEASSDEVDHGVIENHSMRMDHWREALSIFDAMDVKVRTLRHLKSRIGPKFHPANLPNMLLGGVIYGLCRKAASKSAASLPKNPEDWLICPRLLSEQGREAPLIRQGDTYVCEQTGSRYPIVDDIPVLIEPRLRCELYPELE